MKLIGVKTKLTTTFHPQTNGGTEQVNRKIQLYLSIFYINNPESWSQALKKAEFTYNNRTHADREKTPFELMYGSTPKAIIEPYLEKDEPTEERMKKTMAHRRLVSPRIYASKDETENPIDLPSLQKRRSCMVRRNKPSTQIE